MNSESVMNTLKELCEIGAVSGREHSVREYILSRVKEFCEDITVDALGNILVNKKGDQPAKYKVMLDAHMDEVGFMLTTATDDGYFKFCSVGGISPAVLSGRRVIINGNVPGVISAVPVHLLTDKKSEPPAIDDLIIDVGAKNRAEALSVARPGDTAVFDSGYIKMGELIRGRALDDRVGCAVLIEILCNPVKFDICASFSTQEEVGLRGARTAAFTIAPDYAIVLEATTAADYSGVPEDKSVCNLGKGVAVSFMDGATLYDKSLYETALKVAEKHSILCQLKHGTSGGNNAGGISTSGRGVSTLALSIPCRYLHSPHCVAHPDDIAALYDLALKMSGILAEKGKAHE